MFKIWLVLILTFSSIYASHIEDVEKYTKKFAEMVIFGKDSAEVMKNLTENLEELFELGKPIGALLATLQPDEEQQNALEKLNDVMKGKFYELLHSEERQGQILWAPFRYYTVVRNKLRSLSRTYGSVASRFYSDKHLFHGYLEKKCRTSVPDAFQYLKEHYFSPSCSLPTKDEVSAYVRILRAFNRFQPHLYAPEGTKPRRIEEILGAPYDGFYHFHFMKRRILGITNLTNKPEVDYLIHVLEDSLKNPEKFENYFTEQMPQFEFMDEIDETEGGNRCKLDYVVKATSFSRFELNERLNGIRFDMTVMAGLASTCANLISKGAREKEDEFLKEVRANITEIGDFVVSWMKTAMELSYPEIDKEVAKTSLTNQVNLSVHELEKYVQIVQKELNKRTPPGVLTQEPLNYWNVKYGKYMIHVFRLKLHSGNEKNGVSQWFHENYDQMKKQIADSQSLSADMLLKNLNETFNLIGENRWTAALQVRKEAIFCSWAEMNGALGATNGTGYSDVSEIRTQHNVWYRCSNSRIFLFV